MSEARESLPPSEPMTEERMAGLRDCPRLTLGEQEEVFEELARLRALVAPSRNDLAERINTAWDVFVALRAAPTSVSTALPDAEMTP